MSGFDNGTMQQGVFAQTQQFGPILRGSGPPSPAAGVVGSVYLDTQTWFLYTRRSNDRTDPWGHYLYALPDTYQVGLKWFSTSQPLNTIGADGDYCLMFGYPNYGVIPSILGPKAAGVWPANPVDVNVAPNPLYTADDAHAV
jgi:hypothetical protein